MDSDTIEVIEKALACLEREIARYEGFMPRYAALCKSRDELQSILDSHPPLSPADRGMDIREKARLHHEKLMREDPKYREEWEKFNALVGPFRGPK